MKNKGTIALLGITAALALYVYLFEIEKPKKEEALKTAESKFLTIKQDQISQIKIQKTGQPQIVMTKSADGWAVTEPYKDNADNTEVDDFIRSLSDEKYTDIANENKDDSADLKIYGFDLPLGFVEIQDQAGVIEKYTVGSRKNFEGNSFLQKSGDPRILVASQLWGSRVEKTPVEFRDKRLLRASIAKVEKIQIKNQMGTLALEQVENKWKLTNLDFELDQNRAREILTMLNESRALDYIQEKDPDKDQKIRFGFNQPEITLTARVDGQPWEAVIGYSKDKTVYGWVKKPTFVMKLDGPQLDKFKTLSVSFVREKKKAFDFDKAGITSLKYKTTSGKEKSFDKTNPDFSKLVDNLASFQVAEYFSGLRKPQFENTLDLKNENGETVFSFAFGPAYENKKIFGDQKLYLAQTVSLSKP
ncbi:MAG: DUF4340 domain-containing protein, partial [Pseudobdellovibrionaceae bacterium]